MGLYSRCYIPNLLIMQWAGYMVGILHVSITVSLLLLIIVSHTLYHERWLKTAIFLFIMLMFIQHIIFGGCVITVLEKKLSGQEQAPFHSIVESFLSNFGLTLQHYWDYVEVIECVIAICLGLELASLYLAE